MALKMLITGASSGMGLALYRHYAGLPDSIVVGVSRNGPDVRLDLSRAGAVRQLRNACDLQGLPVRSYDVAILNAGRMVLPEQLEDCADIFALNFRFNHFFLSALCEEEGGWSDVIRDGGVVILNASSAGVVGHGEAPFYAAMKAALINLSRSYAKLLAGRGIRVNCFSPGYTITDLVAGEFPEELLDRVPLRRRARPEEMIPVVEALISCEYITGQNIVVDGGYSL